MLTSEQIRAARAMLRIEQKDLAARADVSLETVKRIERSPGVVSAYTSTLNSLQRALEAAGIEFTNGGQPGVRMRAAIIRRPDDGLPKGHTLDPIEADRHPLEDEQRRSQAVRAKPPKRKGAK